VRTPTGTSAFLASPVGIGGTTGGVFIAGTYGIGTVATVFGITGYDFSGTPLGDPVIWPDLEEPRGFRVAKHMAFRERNVAQPSDISRAIVAGEYSTTSGISTVIACFEIKGGTLPTLVGTATMDIPIDQPHDARPVGVAISADGYQVAVLTELEVNGAYSYATALYDTADMTPLWTSTRFYSPNGTERPAAVSIVNDFVLVTGTQTLTSPAQSGCLTLRYDMSDSVTAPVWVNTIYTSGADNLSRTLVKFTNAATQNIEAGFCAIAGSQIVSGKSDFLTAFINTATGATLWAEVDGDPNNPNKNEDAVKATGFLLSSAQGDLLAGYHIYVTGSADAASGTGKDIFTKLYVGDGTTSVLDIWPDGARWANSVGSDDQGVDIELTITDNVNTFGTTKAIVQGWTTNSSGNRDFVAIKYNAEDQLSGGNKLPVWVKIQEDGATDQETPVTLVHRVLFDATASADKLNYFSTGNVVAGGVGRFLTIRFREDQE
jgi:hypothetical protein